MDGQDGEEVATIRYRINREREAGGGSEKGQKDSECPLNLITAPPRGGGEKGRKRRIDRVMGSVPRYP